MTSRTAEKEKPERPLNAYFKYRSKRFGELNKDEKNRSKKIKIEWDEMGSKEKEKMEREYHKELDTYREELEKWEKKHGIKRDKSKKRSDRSESKKDKDRGRSASAKKDKANDKAGNKADDKTGNKTKNKK